MNFELGIHPGIASEIYHSAKGVSNSDLKHFAQSPAHYKAYKSAPRESTQAQIIGTLIHLAILEPEKFGEGVSHWTKPEGMSFATKEGKAWRAEHSSAQIISYEESKNLMGAARSVYSNHQAAALLSNAGANEVSVFAKHPKTGLTLRMRADRLTEDGNGKPWIVDIKSCPDVRKFARSARDFRYDVQGVFYPDVLALAGQPDAQFVFIAVEVEPTNGVHGVRLVMLDEETKLAARSGDSNFPGYEMELERFAECERSGVWPGYSEDIEYMRVRRFAA